MTHAFRLTIASAALAALLSACAAPAPAGADSFANACINPTQIAKQTIVSDDEIRFEMNSGEVWVNKLPRACYGLKFQQGFSWEVRGTQVCSNMQTIYVKEDGTPCQLGAFTRVTAGE